ncbi:hypothetical protein M409DRAFT_71215 [Zasmidium cellare ATCC 36951]|uniref:Amidohydrolase-related domain-containing protein n=1 Tax=Zasmidium cellare ATCC 36951 TaxID=1080233 RepID=A0A6A6BWS1_ZASCE|nr:uncharacterized protein M409DRAFT_71215 [Zasmidium cellare ATCC 36951]KAF2159227.1 hypothetical protein M409DRAFT_71215 [Zasmidium cellare ATCC 36951]
MLHGKIVLEEAYEEPDKVEAKRALLGERLELSKKHGIGYTILSVTGPGCQMIVDPDEAAREAGRLNDHLYEQIKDSREHFGGFASLSMHDPVQAGEELRRCVKELDFHGALLYNFQHAGADAYTWHFYDEPRYDAFWAVCVELNVPIYIHPSLPAGYHDEAFEKAYSGLEGKYLVGPPFQFATGVSLHLLRIIVSGVFDRFSFLQIIHNLYITTSGDFYTPALKYVVEEVGVERVLFSVDYPYETIERAVGVEGYVDVGKGNARRLFGLEGEE